MDRKEYLKEYHKKYKRKDPEYFKKYDKTEDRAAYLKEYKKKWNEQNREKNREQNKKYREKNKDKIKEYRDEYYENNKDKIIAKSVEYKNKKYATDFNYRIKQKIRISIKNSFNRDTKFSKLTSTELILGCSYEDFKMYLESKFDDWMTWDNYGLYEKGKYNVGWDIDHIIPTSSANTNEEFIKLHHYTNLQPLCSKVNRDDKRAKVQA
jgi:hypothetical protein